MTPEEAGLTGCWQFVAVWRERHTLRKGKVVKSEEEYSFHTVSLTKEESSARQVGGLIRGHWGACEIGSHYRRDQTLGEDASRISGRAAAHVMATLRNLTLGLFELHSAKTREKKEKEKQPKRKKGEAEHVPGWRRLMTRTRALSLLAKAA